MKRYGTIETISVVEYWDDRESEIFVKSVISRKIAECLLKEGYIDFKVDENYDNNMMRRVIGSVKVTKMRGDEE